MLSEEVKEYLRENILPSQIREVIETIEYDYVALSYDTFTDLANLAKLELNEFSNSERRQVMDILYSNEFYPSSSSEVYEMFLDAVVKVKGEDFEW